jgi:hypothetical protein
MSTEARHRQEAVEATEIALWLLRDDPPAYVQALPELRRAAKQVTEAVMAKAREQEREEKP